jgi:hypothetical protein
MHTANSTTSRLLDLRRAVKTALAKERSASVARVVTLTLVTTGLAVLLIGCGWAIAKGDTKDLFAVLAAVVLCALALSQRGALIGILLLAAMDGLPFFTTSTLVTSKLSIEDIALIALIVIAGLWIPLDGYLRPPQRVGRIISKAGLPLFVWCMLVMAVSITSDNIPVLRALYFGRDFIFFALLLIVLPRVRLTGRDVYVLLGVLATGVSIFAVGQIMIATGLGQPGNLIHFQYTLQESGFTGLTRVYANMTDMVTAGLAASVAAVMLARDRTVRLIALPMALLLTTSTAVQLTRARWIGLVVGIVLVSLWLMINGKTLVTTVLRKRFALGIGVLGLVIGLTLLAAPGAVSSGTVINRLSSLFTDLQTGGGTVAVREALTRTMKTYLGEQWPFGLGFVPPFSHYFLGLPGGSIRDPDVGVLNAVMTMGVVGAVLIYVPVVATLIDCLRRLSEQRITEFSWLYYGGAIWIVATLASSATLITLFSASGLALTAVFLTILALPSSSEARQVVSSPTVTLQRKPATPRLEPSPSNDINSQSPASPLGV